MRKMIATLDDILLIGIEVLLKEKRARDEAPGNCPGFNYPLSGLEALIDFFPKFF